MKMKYLAWVFVPAMAFGLMACDNAGNEDTRGMSNPAGDSAAGSSSDAAPYGGGSSGAGDTQSSQGTTMPPAGGGSSG